MVTMEVEVTEVSNSLAVKRAVKERLENRFKVALATVEVDGIGTLQDHTND